MAETQASIPETGSFSLTEENSQEVLKDLKKVLSRDAVISLASSEEFVKSNLRFTSYERPTYMLAIRPGNENDVVETVKYATARGIPFAPRAGHHCVTSTMRHLQNGILIDMRSLDSMSFDAEKRQVTIGGGVITDDFVRFLEQHGMEVNVGSCPTTGVVGVSFGAGLGRLQGKYGFLHDNMVSCRLVLADGSIVTASADSHPDLFWAIRGAGHNFGVAVEVTFGVYPQAHGGIHYTWDLSFTLEQCDDLFGRLNEVHEIMPPDLAIFVLWIRQSPAGRKNLILLNLVWSGEEFGGDAWVQKFEALNPIENGGKIKTTWSELPWTTYNGQNKILSDPKLWSFKRYGMMGAVSVERFDLPTTKAFFHSVKEMNEKWAGKGIFGGMFECLPHHRTRELPADSTAFPWRRGTNHFLMMTATALNLDDRDAFEGHLDKWKREFIGTSGYGRLQQYVNYGNTTSTMQDPPEALYGYEPWRLAKLRALKQQYDPGNVFRWYQPLL